MTVNEVKMMKTISDDTLASLEFSVAYEHNNIRHTDSYYAERVNFWRDIFPPQLHNEIIGKKAGEQIVLDVQSGTWVADRNKRNVYEIQPRQIAGLTPLAEPVQPRFGRFYPLGILRGVSGIYPNNIIPFRCINANGDGIKADANHPLSQKPLQVRATIKDVREKFEEHGGTSIDWAETALNGPGMQTRFNGSPTHFFADQPFSRADENPDQLFYGQSRLVQHIDSTAIEIISRLYGRLLEPDSTVLDLMSSWVSHLPDNFSLKHLAGLGMNLEELQANSRLNDHCVHDLNADPQLPFDDHTFDAAICSVSVEYLVRPFEVFKDINRVLKPGGILIVTFSNRWFPTKTIHIWPQLHEFERMGLVLEYFLESGLYNDLHTYSMRGLPRPADDRYAAQFLFSDPVYAVWGYTSGALQE